MVAPFLEDTRPSPPRTHQQRGRRNDVSELIADLPYRIIDTTGNEFYVSVAGEPRVDGLWEGWLEYVPVDESEPLLTPTETTQSTRAALVHWAEALTDTYVQGAFGRAVRSTPDVDVRGIVASRIPPVAPSTPVTDLPDPFLLFQHAPATMRTRLGALPRPMLLDIIAEFGLNPAQNSLSWLRDHQLVTFIVTAVEAQIRSGRHDS
jgi:hypothetical protein